MDITEQERDRIVERWNVALEYVRLRDIIRLELASGLAVGDAQWKKVRELERRFDELDLPPRLTAWAPAPERVGAPYAKRPVVSVEFPDWVSA